MVSHTEGNNAVAQIRSTGGFVYFPETSNIQSMLIGKGVKIHSHAWIGDTVEIGDFCTIQAFCYIPNGVKIGHRVFIGPRVTFTNDKHPPSPHWTKTIVEDKVSIGAGAIILPGITLHAGCKVGAGAVVTKSVPAGMTVAGNPAKPLMKSILEVVAKQENKALGAA